MNLVGKVDLSQSKSYLVLLDAAKQLFWKYGFKKVSVEEIAAKANMSKMTFYRYFKNKIDLAKAVFDKVVDDGLLSFREIMESDLSSVEKIHKLVMLKAAGTNELSEDFLADFYDNPELGLKEYIEAKTRKTWGEALEDIKRAQERGVLRKDFRPELLFYISQKVQELVTDKQMLQLYNNPQELILDVANLMCYGISPRGDVNS